MYRVSRRGRALCHAVLGDLSSSARAWSSRSHSFRSEPGLAMPYKSRISSVFPGSLKHAQNIPVNKTGLVGMSTLAVDGEDKTACLAQNTTAFPMRMDAMRTVRHYAQCYWELSKARLSMLVVATAGAGFVMGSGTVIDYYGLSWTCMGTFLVAAAANTFNQVIEVENDSQMRRTCHRPLPAARITMRHAMAWATMTSIGGVAILASQANTIAAGLGAVNLVLYALVYTPLKQLHPINTWVGAIVGAVPPLLGWAAAAGDVNSMGAWILASALYFWQIPHFMAIAYLCRQDYAAGGFKMLSMQDDSGRRTALAALRNCGYLLPLGFLAHQCGITSEWFGWETAICTTAMGASAALFYHQRTSERARKLFRASLLYLPFLLSAMLIHRKPSEQKVENGSEQNLTRTLKAQDVLVDGEVHHIRHGTRKSALPPVAFFSVAPFPFLPVPDFSYDRQF